MKRAVALTALLAIAAVAGAFVYRSTVRERSYRLLIASGEAAMATDQTLAAVEDFSGAIAVRPDAMLPRLRRGETYRSRGELDLAARDFRQAAQLDPTAPRPLEHLGDVLYAQERFRRAAETYAERLRLDDRSSLVRYKLALARYRDGALDRALDEARRAVQLDGSLAEAQYLVALCLRDLGQTEAAIGQLEQTISRAPALSVLREELADLYASSGRSAELVEQLQVLVSLDRRSERLVALALAQARAGQPDLATLALTGALRGSADRGLLQAGIGRIWLELAEAQGHRPDALPNALEALAQAASAPNATSQVKAHYARALTLAGQLEAAEEVYQQAITRFPVEPTALLHYADVAERLGHAGAARSALVDYAALVPEQGETPAYAVRVGALGLAANDAAGALPWLERAVAAAPDGLQGLKLLADARFRLGDTAGARAALDRALVLAPADGELRTLDRRLASRQAP